MGLLDFTSRVLTTYKADVSQHKDAIKSLSGEEKKAAEARLKNAEAANKASDDLVKGIGKATVAIGALAVAAQTTWAGYKLGVEQARLTTAAMGADVDRLRAASLGLKGTTDLLRDAAKMQSGEFKLSQRQMEDVQRAMIALNRQFNDGGEASKKLMQAVVELKADGLLELGVPIDKAGLSMDVAADRAKLFTRVMQKVAEVGRDVKSGQLAAGEAMEQTTTRLRDSWDKLKISLGQLVTAFEPLLRALTAVIDALGSVAKSVNIGGAVDQYQNNQQGWGALARGMSIPDIQQAYGLQFTGSGFVPYSGGGARSVMDSNALTSFLGFSDFQYGKERKPVERVRYGYAFDDSFAQLVAAEQAEIARRGQRGILGSRASEADEFGYDPIAGYDLAGRANELATQNWRDRIAQGRRSGGGVLEQIFGKPEEFDLYKSMFSDLTSSMANAYSGLVDGTLSGGQAVKQIARDVIKGLGLKLMIRSVEETAEGFAALSNPFTAVSAATHFKAAAVFAGGAVLAGYAASQIGTGGASGGAAAGAGGARGSLPTSYDRPTERREDKPPPIVVIGNSFDRMTPRQRALEAERLVSEALGHSAGGMY